MGDFAAFHGVGLMNERGRFWLCNRCVLLHKDGEACPKQEEEGAGSPGPSLPVLLGRTREDEIRPDENDFAKEMRISARKMEEAGMLNDEDRAYFKEEIERYKDLPGRRIWKDGREIRFVIPKDIRQKIGTRKIFFMGGK